MNDMKECVLFISFLRSCDPRCRFYMVIQEGWLHSQGDLETFTRVLCSQADIKWCCVPDTEEKARRTTWRWLRPQTGRVTCFSIVWKQRPLPLFQLSHFNTSDLHRKRKDRLLCAGALHPQPECQSTMAVCLCRATSLYRWARMLGQPTGKTCHFRCSKGNSERQRELSAPANTAFPLL